MCYQDRTKDLKWASTWISLRRRELTTKDTKDHEGKTATTGAEARGF